MFVYVMLAAFVAAFALAVYAGARRAQSTNGNATEAALAADVACQRDAARAALAEAERENKRLSAGWLASAKLTDDWHALAYKAMREVIDSDRKRDAAQAALEDAKRDHAATEAALAQVQGDAERAEARADEAEQKLTFSEQTVDRLSDEVKVLRASLNVARLDVALAEANVKSARLDAFNARSLVHDGSIAIASLIRFGGELNLKLLESAPTLSESKLVNAWYDAVSIALITSGRMDGNLERVDFAGERERREKELEEGV